MHLVFATISPNDKPASLTCEVWRKAKALQPCYLLLEIFYSDITYSNVACSYLRR